MKRNFITVIALLVTVWAVPSARTEEVKVNFDGGARLSHSGDGLERFFPNFTNTAPTPAAPASAAYNGEVFYKLENTDRKRLLSAISKTDRLNLTLDRDTLSLIEDKRTEIIYNTKSVIFIMLTGSNRYRPIVETDDKYLVDLMTGLQNPVMFQMQSVVVCEFIKEFVTQLMWNEILKVWTQVLVETGKLIKICRTGEGPAVDPGIGGPDSSQGPQARVL